MKKHFLALFALVCGLQIQAQATERLSVEDWAKTWTQATKDKKQTPFLTAALEKNIIDSCVDCRNKLILDTARQLFSAGKFKEAISEYNKITKGDIYWLFAIEEKGWAYFQLENYQKALSQSKTLLAPAFAEIVNPEAYLLQSLSLLKICDYKGVFDTHQVFKEKQKQRILEVQELAKSGWSVHLSDFLKNAKVFPLTFEEMGESSLHLPVMLLKDKEFQKYAIRYKTSEKVLENREKLNSNSIASIEKVHQQSYDSLKTRVQTLAKIETQANFKLIQKLNLVEVETIQRIHTDLNLGEDLYQKKKFSEVDSDKLVFIDDGKPWLDELDKFEIATKACLKGIRRKM